MGILNAIWTFFATYILQKPPYMVVFSPCWATA